jgi:hypothetical protein
MAPEETNRATADPAPAAPPADPAPTADPAPSAKPAPSAGADNGPRWQLPWLRDSWAKTYHRNHLALIRGLPGLSPQQQQFLEYRWLADVDWIEGAAGRNLRMHQLLRVVAILGGAAISGLVGYGVAGPTTDTYRLVTFILSLAVTASIGLDEFFRFGDRWRHERVVVEMMRSEAALYFALAEPYKGKSHTEWFPAFAAAIERLARDDVRAWVTTAVTGGGNTPPRTQDADRNQ